MVNIDLGYHRYIDEKNKEITLLWSILTLDIINILMKKKRSNLALNNIDNGYHKYIDEKNKEITLDWSTQSNLLVYFNLSHIRGFHSCMKALLSLNVFLNANKLLCMNLDKTLVWVMVTLVSIIGQIIH